MKRPRGFKFSPLNHVSISPWPLPAIDTTERVAGSKVTRAPVPACHFTTAAAGAVTLLKALQAQNARASAVPRHIDARVDPRVMSRNDLRRGAVSIVFTLLLPPAPCCCTQHLM